MPERLVFERVEIPRALRGTGDTQLLFEGIDQSGPSYEVRVFVDNPNADATTPTTPDHGYVGSFHVYGYGLWPPDDADTPSVKSSEPREGARAPMTKSVPLPDALTERLRGEAMTVTAVAVPYGSASAEESGVDLTIDVVRVAPGPH